MATCSNCREANPDHARFCLACGASLDEATEERRKIATLLFCDVTGSTALGERVDAESVRELMRRYFAEMRRTIERHGGTVEKFIGDAVMAVFGVPAAHEDDALRGVRAAAEMQQQMPRLNEEFEQQFGHRIALRIGVATGEVVAGDARLRETFVTGDAVNVAARLEQAAAPGETLLDDWTYRLARAAVSVTSVGALALKGKRAGVDAYRLLRVAETPPSREPRLRGRMVGRAKQLAVLREALSNSVTAATCGLTTVLGEAGVGKSRLVAEFAAEASSTAKVLSGRCLSYGEGITFWPIAEIVRELVGGFEDSSRAETHARLARLLEGDDRGAVVAQRVAQAVGLAGGTAPAAEIAWALRTFFEAVARRRPLVLILDDIQWAEQALLDLLEGLAARAKAPILVVCLARPELLEARPDWDASIRLEPLETADAARLARDVLGEGLVSTAALERIVHAAEGNPLFLEELVLMLLDDGLLRRADDTWELARDLEELDVPPTISALLGARLDRLGPGERATIERAAVEGQVFHAGAVAALSSTDATTLIGVLVDKELVQPTEAQFPGEIAYRFRHILIRDAAYHATVKKLRAELHERFAGWLEATAERNGWRVPEIVGYHLEQSFRYRIELGPPREQERQIATRAADQLATAGSDALARGDFAAATNLLARALALPTEDAERRLRAMLQLGEARKETGDLDGAVHVLEEARAAAAATADEALELHAEIGLQSLAVGSARISGEAARSVARKAISRFEEFGDDLGLAKAWHLLGDGYWVEGRWDSRAEALETALVHVRRAGDAREEAEILMWLVSAAFWGWTPVETGIARCERILDEAGRHPVVEAAVETMLGGFYAMQGSFTEARAAYARGKDLAQSLGQTVRVGGRTTVGGVIEKLAGDLAAAERELRLGLEIVRDTGENGLLATVAQSLADALERQDRLEEADEWLRISEQINTEPDPVRARLLARAGRLEEAAALAQDAVVLAAETETPLAPATALETLAIVLERCGRHAEAAQAAEEAVRLHERKGNVVAAQAARARIHA